MTKLALSLKCMNVQHTQVNKYKESHKCVWRLKSTWTFQYINKKTDLKKQPTFLHDECLIECKDRGGIPQHNESSCENPQ